MNRFAKDRLLRQWQLGELFAIAGSTTPMNEQSIMSCRIMPLDLTLDPLEQFTLQITGGIPQDAVMWQRKYWVNAIAFVTEVADPRLWKVIPGPIETITTSDSEGVTAFNAHGDFFYAISNDQLRLSKYDKSAVLQTNRTLKLATNPDGFGFSVAAKHDRVAVTGFNNANGYTLDIYGADILNLINSVVLDNAYAYASRGLAMNRKTIATVGQGPDQRVFWFHINGDFINSMAPSGAFQGAPALYSLDDVALASNKMFIGGGRVNPGTGIESQLVREYGIEYDSRDRPTFTFIADHYPQDLPEEDFGHEYVVTRLDIG